MSEALWWGPAYLTRLEELDPDTDMDKLQGQCNVSRITHGTTRAVVDQWNHEVSSDSREGDGEPQVIYSVCRDYYKISFTTQDPDYPDEYTYNYEFLDRFVFPCEDNDPVCLRRPEFLKPCDFDYNCDEMIDTHPCAGLFDKWSRPCGTDITDDSSDKRI